MKEHQLRMSYCDEFPFSSLDFGFEMNQRTLRRMMGYGQSSSSFSLFVEGQGR